MALSFSISLEERKPDRVHATVALGPGDEPAHLDGVSVELRAPSGAALSPRLLLPVAGQLHGPLVTRVELRASGPIPDGSVVVGTAWCGERAIETSCPADEAGAFEAHVRGSCALRPHGRPRELEELLPDELAALARHLPWLRRRAPPPDEPVVLDDPTEEIEEIAEDLGLDEECADWLKDLMREDG